MSLRRTLRQPNKEPARNMDRIMLLAIWEKHLKSTRPDLEMLAAGMGKPTLPINDRATSEAMANWGDIHNKASAAHLYFKDNENTPQTRSEIAKMSKQGGVIGYSHPQGDPDARILMASALTNWYNKEVKFTPDDVLFTVGGAGAIHNVSKIINDMTPDGWIIAPVPHYSLHETSDPRTKIHGINLMEEKGYRLTKKALEKSIFLARKRNRKISAFFFCDPHNPLGIVTSPEEWRDITVCLRENPDIPIILDEAYAEMLLNGEHYVSLLEVAPDLQDRIILIRSGTKGLSAAGERMAVTATKSAKWMARLLDENIQTVGHAPVIGQRVYSKVLSTFGKTHRMEIADYYRPQVKLAQRRLQAMDASMPDSEYKVEGTFYILANLGDLIGLDIPKAAEVALGRSGKIETDEDTIYSLLFQGVMIAPLSYYGGDPLRGYARITCSGGDEEIEKICDILEKNLIEARKRKKAILEPQISMTHNSLSRTDAGNLAKKYPILKLGSTGSPPSHSLSLSSVLPKHLSFTLKESSSTKYEKKEEKHSDKKREPLTSEALQLKQYITAQQKYLLDVKALPQTARNEQTLTLQAREEALHEYNQKFNCESKNENGKETNNHNESKGKNKNKIKRGGKSLSPPKSSSRKFLTSHKPAETIQRAARNYILRRHLHHIFTHWVKKESTIPPKAQNANLQLTMVDRRDYKPWHDYLRAHATRRTTTEDKNEEGENQLLVLVNK